MATFLSAFADAKWPSGEWRNNRAVNKNLILLLNLLILSSPAVGQQGALPKEGAPKPAADCADLPALQERLEERETWLRDWANLGRYREANANLAAPAKDEQRVVFLGDSITEGWSSPQFGGFFPGKPYINRGIGWQTTAQLLLRFRPDVIALQPQVVVILAGANDIASNTGPMTLEETEGNLASMAELGRAHGIRVVLSSLMPVSDAITNAEGKKRLQTPDRPPEKILALNEWIREYAAANGFVFLDYFSATADEKGFLKSELTLDGLHPNAKGYAVMAPLAEKAIHEALAAKP